MEMSLPRALEALLDPLAAVTVVGCLVGLWALWKVLLDRVDLEFLGRGEDDAGRSRVTRPDAAAGAAGDVRAGVADSARREPMP